MKTTHQKTLKINQEWQAWMDIANPELSLEEAVAKLKDLGNEILEVDEANRRIKVLHVNSDNEETWGCDYCDTFANDYEAIAKHESEQHNNEKENT